MKRRKMSRVLGLLILCTVLAGCTAAQTASTSQEEGSVALAEATIEAEAEATAEETIEAEVEAPAEETSEAKMETSAVETAEARQEDGVEATEETAGKETTVKETAIESTAEEASDEETKEEAAEATQEATETKSTEEAKKTDTKEGEEAARKDAADKAASGKEEAELLKEYTGAVQTYEAPKTLYATIALNVRRGPGTNYEIIGSFALNQAVEAIGITENGWIQCSFGGQTGFASGKYLAQAKVEPQAEAAANTAGPAVIMGSGGEVPAAIIGSAAKTPAATIAPAAGTPAVTPASAATPAATQAPAATLAATPAPAATTAEGGIIMIGDSRCVQMQAAVNGGGVSWICENGKGYDWLSETAIGWADPSVGKGTKVVICLGVNDPENIRHYADLINAKAADWSARGAIVYYVSVNPVWENPYVTKEEVEYFNSTMPGLLSGVIWVDTYTWLMENGCRIVDGLHYDDPTSVNIFNLIMGGI